MAKRDDAFFAALQACVEHARHLLESAKLVQESGRPNIAYHLAVLSLEEIGRRELLQMHAVAETVADVPPWQTKATQDHVKKLFWCFYGMGRIQDAVDQQQFFEKREAAADVHALRLAGLYVEASDTGLNVPSQAISSEQAQSLISLAESLVMKSESEKPRENIPDEDIELQRWFLKAFDDPATRSRILARESIEKLKTLNDVPAWTRELKAEIEATNAELQALLEAEMQRSPQSRDAQKDRWKIQLRIRSAANIIRSKPLKKWNERMRWIKLYQQQGALKKEELLVEILLADNVPLGRIWDLGMALSFNLIVGLNFATSGFWWWTLPPNQQRFYERIRDLDKRLDIQVESPEFKVWDRTAQLTDVHIDHLVRCMAALPSGPNEQDRSPAYSHYLGGLTFISLNSIQWRCEAEAFGNFVQSFALLMKEAEFIEPAEATDIAVGRFIDANFPELDPPEKDSLLALIRVFESRKGRPSAKIGDVYFMKLLCETIFRDSIVPQVLRRKAQERGGADSDIVPKGN